jgi:purine nucleosidase/non-specific riboncleoside hydrolase
MAPNRLILDTDGGVDDAQALLLLIAAGRAPGAITTVFGNVSLDAATQNVLAVLAVAGAAIPVHPGAEQPLAQERIDARHVHGEDGLGGAPRPDRTADITGSDAVGFLVTTLSDAAASADPVDLLMIGPLTNLALALQRAPRIAGGVGQLTIMGGTFSVAATSRRPPSSTSSRTPGGGHRSRAPIEITVIPGSLVLHTRVGAEIDRMFAPVPTATTRHSCRPSSSTSGKGISATTRETVCSSSILWPPPSSSRPASSPDRYAPRWRSPSSRASPAA